MSDYKPHVVIDEQKNIILPEELKNHMVQYDHNVKTITFDCPRYSDGRDLSTMRIYVNYFRTSGEKDADRCENITVDSKDNNLIHFEWIPKRSATLEQGVLAFLICAEKEDAGGNQENAWHTKLCKDLKIAEGIDCLKAVIEKYPTIITYLLTRMEDVESIATPEAMQAYVNQYLLDYPPSGMTEEERALLEENFALTSQLSSEIDDVYTRYIDTDVLSRSKWTQGGYGVIENYDAPNPNTSTLRIRTELVLDNVQNDIVIGLKNKGNYSYVCGVFNSVNEGLGYKNTWQTNDFKVSGNANGSVKTVRIALKKNADTDIIPSDWIDSGLYIIVDGQNIFSISDLVNEINSINIDGEFDYLSFYLNNDNVFPCNPNLWRMSTIDDNGEYAESKSRFASELLSFDDTIGSKNFGKLIYECLGDFCVSGIFLYENATFIKKVNPAIWVENVGTFSVLLSIDIPSNITHYRLLVKPINDRGVKDNEKRLLNIFATLKPSRIEFCSYNIGHYNKGGTAPVGADINDNTILEKWFNAIGKIKADIVATQETYEWFYNNDTSNAYDTLWKHFYPFRSANDWVNNIHYGLDLFSTHKASKAIIHDNTDPSGTSDAYNRHFTETIIEIDNKKVWVYNCHLHNGHSETDIEARKVQMAEILNVAKTKPRWIVCGDLNVGEEEVNGYSVFTEYNCNVANCGNFGVFKTYHTGNALYPMDNIITSPNINIISVELVDVNVSDHYPLKATLAIH